MKVLILTFGSTGDVIPYVALGKGLMDRGHSVAICTNSRFEALIKNHGLEYLYMSDEITQLIESVVGRKILEGLNSFVGFLKTIFKLMNKMSKLQGDILSDTWSATQKFNPDLIVFSPKNYAAVHFAEKLNIAAIPAPLFPQYVPTKEMPTLGFPVLGRSHRYNRFTYNLVRMLSSPIGGGHIKRWRMNNGLKPTFCGIDICQDATGKKNLVLNGYSNSVIPAPDDWPKSVHNVGFWFLKQSESWSPPQELLNFLAEGAPPVYVGFGSMASSQSKKVTKIVIDALGKSGVRAILATGWGGLDSDQLPETIFSVDNVPHDWLFPKVSAVIHHGGAGTTGAGLKAGCPTLICPIFGDQPFWGRVVNDLGVGVTPIPQNKLTVENLSLAITQLVSTPSIKKRAHELSLQIAKEDGIASAIAIIESEMNSVKIGMA